MIMKPGRLITWKKLRNTREMRMNRSAVFETLVGVLVIVVAVAFMVYAYGVSGRDSVRDSYHLDAVFGRIDGITIGSEVRIAGMKIGSVSAHQLNFKTYEADLQLLIQNNVLIPDDSVAKIVSDGLLGGAHVSIEPGASEEMLREGDKITITQGSVDLLGIAVQAFTSQASKGSHDGGDGKAERDPLGEF
jgi:phospholipid/cholesterol/gamma-HCH transport system substrate-binding protein